MSPSRQKGVDVVVHAYNRVKIPRTERDDFQIPKLSSYTASKITELNRLVHFHGQK